jgi:hypothetical protein
MSVIYRTFIDNIDMRNILSQIERKKEREKERLIEKDLIRKFNM